jgi:hypothetical protein
MDNKREGGCNCGAVRLEIRGEPLRVGICHCLTCRKETGSAFMPFAVWRQAQVTIHGASQSWIASTDHRHFCPACGSTLFGTHDDDDEIEVRLGALDQAPSGLTPSYELWIHRREGWLPKVERAAQHSGKRPANSDKKA